MKISGYLLPFLVVLGIFSFRDLGVDLFPKADPATVTINVRLPGATSEEVTTQVVLPLEESVSTISGLDELNSQATEGSARITCKFLLEREIESAAQDVREKVAGALRNLPPNILPPIIQKADPDSDPDTDPDLFCLGICFRITISPDDSPDYFDRR